MTDIQQATENRRYLRRLLGERQPRFAAMLQAVEQRIAQEPPAGAHRAPAHVCGRRNIMNTARLYHRDSSVCVDRWSCREPEHTSVPPRCGGQIGCELPKGHPGPHLHLTDHQKCER